nr:hypothetical protein [Tanacetum cinerariifolium]
MGYSFYYPPENKVLFARNAEFFKNSLITQEASESLEDLEIIQEEDTHPSKNTSLHHDKDNQVINEPQSDINLIPWSTRTRHTPDQTCIYIDAEEHELGDLNEPDNYKTALLDHEFDKWLNAMNVEMQSIKDNQVWDLVDLLPNGKTIGSKWLFKKKTDMDGVVHTYKAHLVAKGFTQTYEVDYEETFSHVAEIIDIRILIAIANFYDYEIWQWMSKTAFLNRHLSKEDLKEGIDDLCKIRPQFIVQVLKHVNLPPSMSTLSAILIGYWKDLSANLTLIFVGLRVPMESFAYKEYGIRFMLARRSAKALQEKALLKLHGMRKLPGSLSFGGTLF